MQEGPLKNIKVIEFEGLAPTVFLGMILADFGAQVTIISRLNNTNPIGIDTHMTYQNRGKKSIAFDLKNKLHIKILKQMMSQADVIIDCYRPGVLANLGIGPKDIPNEKLIFAMVTGYGQSGPLSKLAGHDINYLGYSGLLSTFSSHQQNPDPPNNILADFAAGGGFGVMGILLALYERNSTGKGQIVDISLSDCVGYMGSFLHNMKKNGFWNNKRGENILDGGAPYYRTYKCKDGKYIAVGCIESQFYRRFLQGLEIKNIEEYVDSQLDFETYNRVQKEFEDIILSKNRDEWNEIFFKLDCCATPIIEMEEMQNSINAQQLVYKQSNQAYQFEYKPQPNLSNYRELGKNKIAPNRGENTIEVLKEFQISEENIKNFISNKAKL